MNEMCWMSIGNLEEGEKILHLNVKGIWKPYTMFPELPADYTIPRGSRGYCAMQGLLKQGWSLVAAPEQAGDPGFNEETRPTNESLKTWTDIYGVPAT